MVYTANTGAHHSVYEVRICQHHHYSPPRIPRRKYLDLCDDVTVSRLAVDSVTPTLSAETARAASPTGSRAAVVGPLLALLALPAATIPQDHEALRAMFLVCALLLASAVLGAGSVCSAPGSRCSPTGLGPARSAPPTRGATGSMRPCDPSSRPSAGSGSRCSCTCTTAMRASRRRSARSAGLVSWRWVTRSRCCSGRLPPPCSTTRIATFLRLATCTRPSSRSSRLPS